MSGFVAIEASAGTGKTYAITRRWLRLLLVEGIPVERILVSTFTQAATAELAERLLTTLREARAGLEGTPLPEDLRAIVDQAAGEDRDLAAELDRALSRFDLAPISTIHGFCTSLIERHGLELGADPEVELVAACDPVVAELVGDALMAEADAAPIAPDEAARIARRVVEELALEDERVLLPPPPVGDVRARYRAALDQLGELLGDAEARLVATVAKNSVAKTLRIMRALATGDASGENGAPLATGVVKKLTQGWPEALTAIDAARTAIAERRSLALHDLTAKLRRHLPTELARRGLRRFDDVLVLVRDALTESTETDGATGRAAELAAAIRHDYDAVIIDECQDSDAVQIAVFARLFIGQQPGATAEPLRELVVIGDPKQSIYRFRGADLGSYRALAERAVPEAPMATNYRSDGDLVAAINALYAERPEFDHAAAEQPIRYHRVAAAAAASRITDPGLTGALHALMSDQQDRSLAQDELAAQVAAECHRLLATGVEIEDRHSGRPRPLRADDIAVLAADRDQLALVRRQLERHGIACQQAGRGLGSVLGSEEARDLLHWLEALATCERGGEGLLARLMALAASPLRGLDAAGCLALGADPAAQAELAERCRRDATRLRREGPLPVLLRALAADDAPQRVLATAAGERRIANWRHLGELLQARWAADCREAELLVRELARAIEAAGEGAIGADSELMRLATDRPAVQLVTVHAAKGLEYPLVFCPFLWCLRSRSGTPPTAVVRGAHSALLDLGSEDFEEHLAAERRQLDEEAQRLCYVALTRARHRCYLGLAPVPDTNRSSANGAERAPIARLLGLDQQPHDEWRAAVAERVPLLDPPTATASTTVLAATPPLRLVDPPRPRPARRAMARSVSFSGLGSGEHEFQVVRDHDEVVALGEPVVEARVPGLLAGLGGGTGLGDRIHTILEEVLGNRRELAELLGPRPPEGPALSTAVAAILDAPIPLPTGDAPPLRELASRSIAELHFLLPLATIDPAALAAALLADPAIGGDPLRRRWAEHLGGWSFGRLEGYLQGYIDLIVERSGRWYVLDYKTNQLSGYDATACEHAMLEHDYLLQGRLYLLALHRHLRHHLADYDPARHLGGTLYCFVRGLPAAGVWREAADPAAVAALDALAAGGAK